MEIVIGTYEELVLGFKLLKSDDGYKLEASFSDHSHTGCLKAVAISGRGILASGSSDEMIRLYNLRTRTEMGALAHHEGTLTSICFHGKKHMLTGSEDGTLAVWKVGRWECLRSLRGHKDHVTDFSVHPSGKLALSTSRDRTLKTWNLITGKCAYTSNIKLIAESVLWSPVGDKYLLINGNTINLYKVETAELSQSIQCGSRICCSLFLRDNVLAVGGEGGDVHLFDITENKHITKFSTDTNRVKGISLCQYEDREWLVTVSSDGTIQLWTIEEKEGEWTFKKQLSHQQTFRPTCVAVYVKSQTEEEEASKQTISAQSSKHGDSHTSQNKRKLTIEVEHESEEPDEKKKAVSFDSTNTNCDEVKKKKKKKGDKVKKIEISEEKKDLINPKKKKKINPDKKMQLF